MKPDFDRSHILAAWEKHGGNVSAMSRELGLERSTIRHHLRRLGISKPLAKGKVKAMKEVSHKPPQTGVRRFLLTSAQNNTHVHAEFWKNLLAFAAYVGADIRVSTFTYNKQAYGARSVKKGTADSKKVEEPWFASEVVPYLSDVREELAPGLVFCGETNILPTAVRPLSGFETYTGRRSGIFPHAKIAMQSVAAHKGEPAKFNYTTGCVTLRNYLQMKAGLKAEFHHCYGALLVEVTSEGRWYVRQINADSTGAFYDLDRHVKDGKVTTGHRVEAITWGDVHASRIDKGVALLAWGSDGMLDTLRPKFQFMHDLFDGESVNRHDRGNFHTAFKKRMTGKDDVQSELHGAARLLNDAQRDWCETVIVASNHDDFLRRWLVEVDYRHDIQNARFHLEAQLAFVKAVEERQPAPNFLEFGLKWVNEQNWVDQKFDLSKVRFLRIDESFRVCRGQIECGMHGHLGPDGVKGSPMALSKVGRRANTGHTHSAGIFDGLYVAGTSSVLDHGYNVGPSSWSHSHVVTYPNGKRAIVTMWGGGWRA